MKSSTARQLDFFKSENFWEAPERDSAALGSDEDSSLKLRWANQQSAISARIAGRRNAANVSAEEHKALLDERQKLLDKLFDKSITRAEQNRLEYVRWSLDRIDDARHGQELDILESLVTEYEYFRDGLKRLEEQIMGHLGGKK